MKSKARASRRLLRWLIGCLVLLIFLSVGLIAVAPLIAGSIASNTVLKGLGDQLQGQATISRVRLSWFGSQRIENLAIIDAGGASLADVSVEAPVSLWSLVWGSRDFGTISVSGVIHVERDAEGRLNWEGVLPASEAGGAAPRTSEPTGPKAVPRTWPTARLPRSLRGIVDFSGLKATYVDHREGARLELALDSGQASIQSGGPINLVARGFVADGSDLHPVGGKVEITDAIDAEGQLDLEAARLMADASWQLPGLIVDLLGDETLAHAIGRKGVLTGRLEAEATTQSIRTDLLTEAASSRIKLDADLRGDLRMPAKLAGDASLSCSVASSILASLAPAYAGYVNGVAGEDVVFEADVSGGLTGGSARISVNSGDGIAVAGDVVMTDGRIATNGQPVRMQLRVTPALLQAVGAEGLELVEGGGDTAVLEVSELELLLSDEGQPAFDQTGGTVTVTMPPLALTGDSPVGSVVIRDAVARVDSGDLTESIRLTARGVAGPPDQTTGQLRIDIRVDSVFDKARPSVTDAVVEGTAIVEAFPSVVLQPWLASIRAEAERDLGPTITGQIDLLGNPVGADGLTVVADITGAHASVAAAVKIADGEVTTVSEGIRLAATLDHRWLHAWTGDDGPVDFTAPADVTLAIDDLRLAKAAEQLDPAGIRLDGYVDVRLPSLDVGGVPIDSSELRVDVATAPESSRLLVSINGSSNVEADAVGVRGQMSLAADSLVFGGDGPFDVDRAVSQLEPTGQIRIERLPLRLAHQFLGEHAELAEIAGALANLELQLHTDAQGTSLTTLARSSNLSLNAETVLKSRVVSLRRASVHGTLTPDAFETLAARYLTPDEKGTDPESEATTLPMLRAPARIKLTVNPLDYSLDRDDDDSLVVTAHVALLDDADVSGLPGVVRTMRIANFRSTATTDLGGRQPHQFRGAMALHDAEGDASLSSLELEAEVPTAVGEPRTVRATLRGVDVGLAESMLGRDAGSLTGLLGNGGNLSLTVVPDRSDETVELELAFDRLRGALAGRIVDDVLAVSEPATLQLSVAPDAATKLVAQVLDEPESPPLRFAQEAVLNVSAGTLEIGLDKPADWTSWLVDAQASIPSVTGTTLSGQAFGYRDLQATLRSSRQSEVTDQARPVDEIKLTLRGFSRSQPENSTSPAIDIDLTADVATSSDQADESSKVAFAETEWNGVVMIDNLDTSLIDELSSMNGSLVNALGSNATLHAALRNLSAMSGRVEMRFTSPTSSLVLSGDVDDGSFRVDPGARASLAASQPFVADVLASLFPILGLAEASSTAPTTFTVKSLTLPLDGDPSGLNGVVVVDLGGLSYSIKPPLDAILEATSNDVEGSTVGLLEEMQLNITDGVVRYQDVGLVLNRTRMTLAGRANLTTRRGRFDVGVPLGELDEGLFRGIGGLGDVLDVIPPETVVPLVFRGPLDKLEFVPDEMVNTLIESAGSNLLNQQLRRLFEEG